MRLFLPMSAGAADADFDIGNDCIPTWAASEVHADAMLRLSQHCRFYLV
jgi:hypothetical protein